MRRYAFITVLLLGFLGVPLSAQALALTRNPYLQMVTQTTISVRWRTDLASDSDLCYHTVLANVATQCQNEPGPVTEHEVELTGLTANTKYFYSVGDDDPTVLAGADADHYFWTQPAADSTDAVRIVYMSDGHAAGIGDTTGLENVRDGYFTFVGSNLADIFVTGGDNAGQDGTDAEHTSDVFTPLATMLRNTHFFPAVGNHECGGGNTDPFLASFTLPDGAELGGVASGSEEFYSFDYANIHFIMLSVGCTAYVSGSDQYNWFVSEIAALDKDWTIIVVHYPPYSMGNIKSDTSIPMTYLREVYAPIWEAAGVDLVLSGHNHCYERSMFLNGHYADSDTFDPNSMVVEPGCGGGLCGSPYTKTGGGPVADSGTVYALVPSNIVLGETLDYPAMVVNYGTTTSNSPPGTGDQGSLVIDIQDQVLNAHFVHRTGVAWDHFQIRKVPGDIPVPALPWWGYLALAAVILTFGLAGIAAGRRRRAL